MILLKNSLKNPRIRLTPPKWAEVMPGFAGHDPKSRHKKNRNWPCRFQLIREIRPLLPPRSLFLSSIPFLVRTGKARSSSRPCKG